MSDFKIVSLLNPGGVSIQSGIIAASLSGNTAGVLADISTGTIYLAGGNNITLSQNANSVTISAGAAAAGSILVSAGTTNTSFSNFSFSDGSGVSWGVNGSTITASVQTNYLTSQSNQNAVASNGNFNFQTISFSNANGVSFGTSAGSAIFASYTVPTVTNSSWTVSDAATSGTVARLAFTNLNGVTLSLSTGAAGSHTIVGSHNALTSQSNQNVTAANGGFAFQTLSFSNLNGISFGTSAGSAITASHNGITSQSNQQMTLFATSNTTQSSSGTTNASSLIFAGAGIASVGISNGSVVISVPTGAPSPVNFSAGTTSSDIGSVVFSNSNGVSFGLNGSTITASVAAAGGGGVTYSSWYNYFPLVQTSQNTTTILASTSVIFPLVNVPQISIGYARMLVSGSFPSTSFASTANTSYSMNNQLTFNHVLYTRGTGTDSTILQSIFSTSGSFRYSVRLSRNTTNNISVSHGLTYFQSNGTSSTSWSYAATNSSDQFSTTHLTVATGPKILDLQFATSLPGGQYWIAFGVSSAITTQQTVNISNLSILPRYFAMFLPAQSFGMFGSASTNTLGWAGEGGAGTFSTAGGVTTASIPLSRINGLANYPMPMYGFERNT